MWKGTRAMTVMLKTMTWRPMIRRKWEPEITLTRCATRRTKCVRTCSRRARPTAVDIKAGRCTGTDSKSKSTSTETVAAMYRTPSFIQSKFRPNVALLCEGGFFLLPILSLNYLILSLSVSYWNSLRYIKS